MSFWRAWSLESLQNLPMILGFMLAAFLLQFNLMLSLVALLVGILLGNLVMHFTEPLLHTEPAESTLKGTLINIAAFVILAVPFLFYFTASTAWISWKSDLILGVIAGLVLTLAQSAAWQGPKSRMLLHGLAMAVSFPLIMVGIRYALTLASWPLIMLAGALVTIFASAVIVLIDYQAILNIGANPDSQD
jgi:hypothetical protein